MQITRQTKIADIIKKTAFKVTRMGQLVGVEASKMLDVPFGIVDLSLAPTPAVGDSVAHILEEMGFTKCPVCMAKTQYSFSDDMTKLGAPTGFTVTVRNLKISAGAGFIVVLTGDIMTMPGLPKVPAAEKIDVDSTGKISGLF